MARLLFDRRARLACALIWGLAWLVVAALMLMPLGVPGPPGSDLAVHFLVFGTMAFAAVSFSRHPGRLAGFALMTIALGAALEYAQSFVPYRSPAIADAVADGAGALIGYALALLVLYFVIRPAEPRFRPVAP
jgi:VanZ family protein